MIRKSHIAYCIFLIILCYLIWPWIFAKKFLFNELIAVIGMLMLAFKRFKVGTDTISICIMTLLLWGAVHCIISLARMDSLYYYLRNMVLIYSIAAFFIGFYCLKYLNDFISKIRSLLKAISTLSFIPISGLVERFNMSVIFPALFQKAVWRKTLIWLVVLNTIYGIAYDAFTTLVLASFYLFLLVCPGYKFFKQVTIVGFLCFTAVFIYLQPNLSLISVGFNPFSYDAIFNVMKSHPILSLDGNSTWRMVLWKQVIVDNFPGNMFGMGLGTPLLKYFPVEDFNKLPDLPYILGAHNSFVYLFGRLGIIYPVLAIAYYRSIFREYFYHKQYYYGNNQILLFWSFFASTIIAVFNPALESPIFATGYWLMLGFVARAIYNRKQISKQLSHP